MAHYAEINENNEVIYVTYMDNEIITDENGNEIEQLGIDHLHFHHGREKRWVRTSYGGNFRGPYAGIGYIYREDLDLFVPPCIHPSWIFDESTLEYLPPTHKPLLTQEQMEANQYYMWSEEDYISNNNGWILTTDEEFTE